MSWFKQKKKVLPFLQKRSCTYGYDATRMTVHCAKAVMLDDAQLSDIR